MVVTRKNNERHTSPLTGQIFFCISKNSSTVQKEPDEEKLLAHADQLKLQGAWTKWCSFLWMDLSWKSILSMPPSLLSLCLGATYNSLPLPSNLHKLNISTKTSCQLCHKQICTHPWSL